jgi:DNA polymerase
MPTSEVTQFDIESTSVADLRRTGVHAYAEAQTPGGEPQTHIICVAWAKGGDDPELWFPGEPVPQAIIDHAAAGGRFAGWNVGFDATMWLTILTPRHGWPQVRFPEQFECTMARATYWGCPASLDVAGRALGLNITKDKAGHALMLQMARPRSFDPFGRPVWWHVTDPAKRMRLANYCVVDVESERAVARALPPLPPRERAIWELDQRMNARGVRVDTCLVSAMTGVADRAQRDITQRLKALTSGEVTSTNQVAALTGWLQKNGLFIPNLQKGTVADTLKHAPRGIARDALALRAEGSKASTAKLTAFTEAVCIDERVRGMLRYYGAGRTGRWSGAGGAKVQPQNLPRGSIKDVMLAIRMILAGAPLDHIEALFEDSVLGVVASCLRGCFIASDGHLLVCADFAQIEARVIAWLAGQQDILDVFASGEDVYVYTAQGIGSSSRTLGKVCVLGLGFGMGAPKFQATAATYGLALDAEFAESTVYAWRDKNRRIVSFWYDLDRAMRECIEAPFGTRTRAGRIVFIRGNDGVGMQLPSGRLLIYRNARIEYDPYTGRDAITFDGISQTTKQWGAIRTYGGKLAENCTQAVARDVMADAMLALDARGQNLLLSVHDELIGEAPKADAQRTLGEMLAVMRTAPTWAPGLPVGAEGWIGPRYRKG